MNQKNKINRILIFIMFFVIGIICTTTSYAGISVSTTSVEAKVGETKTVNLIGSDVTGTVNVTSSNSNVVTVSASNWIENNTVSISITAKSAGTATITVSGVVTNSAKPAEGDSNYSKTINVKVSATVQQPENNNNSNMPTTNTGDGNSNPTESNPEPTPPQTQTPPATETKKSNNANLSNLGITPNDFKGFTPGTTKYDVEVPNDVESVNVYATKADKNAKVTGTGNKTLNEGLNTFNVEVTAEDGTTKKTYTLNITRKATDEEEEPDEIVENSEDANTQNDDEPKEGLETLKIGTLSLEPTFKTNVYEYKVKYIGTDEKLDIEAKATDETYKVEITGNEGLEEGENLITILVSDDKGENVATYQITVEKSLIDREAIAKEEERLQKERQNLIIIIAVVVAVVALAAIIFLVIRNRKKYEDDDYEYDDDFEDNDEGIENNDFEDEDLQDDQNDEEEQEKVVEKKKKKKKHVEENYDDLNQKDIDNFDSNEYNNEYDDYDYDNRHRFLRRKTSKGKRFKD